MRYRNTVCQRIGIKSLSMTLRCEPITANTISVSKKIFMEVNIWVVFAINSEKNRLTINEITIGKKMINARLLKIHHGVTANPSTCKAQNNTGTVNGAMIEVRIKILVESAMLPLTISVKAGEAAPAGMAVSNKIPTASSGLIKLVASKSRTGTTSMNIKTMNAIYR